MCGIAGLFATRGPLQMPDGVVEAMCEQIVHRGPDDRGVYRHACGQIGMQRLSIIDLSTGHQPIANEDRTVWIVFNGEIYNFHDLRRELEGMGHVFATHSDTECIVHGYEQWGEAVFERLRGMFGVAILDLNQRKLVLARDRLGKKPLYYTTLADGTLAFGSELKCLTVVPGFRAQVSAQATHDYFAFGYVPAPASIYEGVFKLPPAHVSWRKAGTRARIATGNPCSARSGPTTQRPCRIGSFTNSKMRCGCAWSATCHSARSSAAGSTPAWSPR